MKATFDHSVKVLLKAYLNDTLAHGNCYACAVGNLVLDACGYEYVKARDVQTMHAKMLLSDTLLWRDNLVQWHDVFMTCNKNQHINPNGYAGNAKNQIDSTGYNWKELSRIEFAFETANQGNSEDDYMFNGLMAVIDVLAEIHNIDLVTVKETKEMFV
jgi:hypothetical protein